jgi:hypothetical protein
MWSDVMTESGMLGGDGPVLPESPPVDPPAASFSPCLLCLRGTDLILLLRGRPEWVITAMQMLGLSMDQAERMLEAGMGWPPGMVPNVENVDVALRLCQTCAEGHGVTVGVPPAAPVFAQPSSDGRHTIG